MFRALIFVSIAVAAIMVARINILLLPLILNWLACALIDRRGAKDGEEKPPLLQRHAGYAVQAIQFVLLEILIIAPWVLCAAIAFSVRLQGLALILMAAGFFLIVLSSERIKMPDGNPGKILAGNWLIAGAAVLATVLLLDRFYLFEYTLLLAFSFLAGLFAVHILWNCGAMTWKGLMDDTRRVRLWICLAVLWGGLFYAVMNLSATGSFRLFADDVGFALKPSHRATINSLGFRGAEIPVEKPANTFRIAILGDSATYGWLISERFTYSRVLERMLRSSSRDMKFEVINAGVPAYGLLRIISHTEANVLELEPDVIVLATGGNDKGLVKKGKYRKYLKRFFQSAKRSGAELVVCSYPFPKSTKMNMSINRELRSIAKIQDAVFIDLYNALKDYEDYFLSDGHPGKQGNAAIARLIFDTLADEGIVREEWLRAGAPPGRARRL